jgi:hypothetical protein
MRFHHDGIAAQFARQCPRTPYRHLQRSLDWTGMACGLTFQVTGPHTNGLLPFVSLALKPSASYDLVHEVS